MAYKWKPSKSAKRVFAQKMATDNDFATAYNANKSAKADKKRASSQFDYSSAGGSFVPTHEQYLFCMQNMHLATQSDDPLKLTDAFNQIIFGYSCKEKVHHDYIHLINELRRLNP